MAELAAVAMLTLIAIAAWWILRRAEPEVTDKGPLTPPTIAPEPPSPLDRARALRADAMEACERAAWRACLDGLDRARGLDPEGDLAPAVGAARAKAEEALRAAPPSTVAPIPSAPSTAAPIEPTPQKSSPPTKPTSVFAPKPPAPSDDKKGDVDAPTPQQQTPVEPKGKFAPRKGGGKALKKVFDDPSF